MTTSPLHQSQPDEGGRSEERLCRGFRWMGQPFEHCEDCGRDLREHDGLAWHDRSASLFSAETVVIPFAEAMRRIPMFAYLVTPINKPEGPYRYEAAVTA